MRLIFSRKPDLLTSRVKNDGQKLRVFRVFRLPNMLRKAHIVISHIKLKEILSATF